MTNLNSWRQSPDGQLLAKYGVFNPMGTGNYSATSNNMKLVHWSFMGGLLHLVQQEGGLGVAAARSGPSLLYQM